MADFATLSHNFDADLEKYRAADNMEEFYDKWANEYDNVLLPSHLMAVNDFAAQLLYSKVEDKEVKILDVACGTGLTGVALQNVGYKTIDGIDLSNEMLGKAKEKNIYRNLLQGCINEKDSLPHDNDSYDIVTCMGAIVKNSIAIEHALRDFIRVTKPGGYCAYTVNDIHNERSCFESHGKVITALKCELVLMEQRFYYVKDNKETNCYFCMIKVL